MSKYTTELRFICESLAEVDSSLGYYDVDAIITKAMPKIFDFNYPIFNSSYKAILERKILQHYYTREISEESFGLWKLRLKTKMNEIMPYYNKMYESELIQFNPMEDVDLTTKHDASKTEDTSRTENNKFDSTSNYTLEGTKDDTGKLDETETVNRHIEDSETKTTADSASSTDEKNSTVNNTSKSKEIDASKDLYSDTPQGGVEGLDTETYLTNARKINAQKDVDATTTSTDKTTASYNFKDDKTELTDKTSDDNVTNNKLNTTTNKNVYQESRDDVQKDVRDIITNEKLTGNDNYINTVKGKSSGMSYSKLLEEYRETFLNIDMEIIKELSPLFFNLW